MYAGISSYDSSGTPNRQQRKRAVRTMPRSSVDARCTARLRFRGRASYDWMMLRALVVFPQANQFDVVERMRRRYDPQARLIAAHVTIVFPFDDPMSDAELRAHVLEATTGLSPFKLRFSGIAPADDYIFLHPTTGADRLVALHNRLYTGQLLRYRSRTHAFQPHVTIGRVADDAGRAEAADIMRNSITDFDAEVSAVCVFRLNGPDQGAIDATIPLRQ